MLLKNWSSLLSKSKNRNRTEVEYLRGQIRELEKENKSLRRELKQYRNRTNEFEEHKEELEALAMLQANEEEYQSTLINCFKCKIGTMDSFEVIPGKFIFTCIECGFRHSNHSSDKNGKL